MTIHEENPNYLAHGGRGLLIPTASMQCNSGRAGVHIQNLCRVDLVIIMGDGNESLPSNLVPTGVCLDKA